MEMTNCQKEGNRKIRLWLTKKPTALSDRIFILTGKAGTGKTTLIKYALEDYLRKKKTALTSYTYPPVAGVCMSHKAKHVLTGSIPDCFTYAGYFGHKIDHKPNGLIDFVKRKSSPWRKFPHEMPIPFVVHDECSMYNVQMLNEVLEQTHPSSKIIFMGDPGQLPPINADGIDVDSPIFTLKIDKDSRHHLVERVRQTDENPIVPLSDIVYDEIFGSQRFKPLYERTFEDELTESGQGFQKVSVFDLADKFVEVSNDDVLNSKIIAYRRKAVDGLNQLIREKLFGQISEPYVPGDVIVFNNTLVNDPQQGTMDDYTFYNSDEYRINRVEEGTYLDIKVTILGVDIPKGENHHLENIQNPFFRVVHPQGIKVYKEKLKDLYQIAISETDKKEKVRRWSEYHDFREAFGDISYAYAMTCYKAQGSTYRNVFVDVNDIRTTGPLSKKRKLQSIYTALTRASHNVYFISQYE